MADFPRNNVISSIVLAELRIKRVGISPSIMAKLTYMSNTGITFGSSLLHSGFSRKTQMLLEQAFQAIEEDAANLVASGQPLSEDSRRTAAEDGMHIGEDGRLDEDDEGQEPFR